MDYSIYANACPNCGEKIANHPSDLSLPFGRLRQRHLLACRLARNMNIVQADLENRTPKRCEVALPTCAILFVAIQWHAFQLERARLLDPGA